MENPSKNGGAASSSCSVRKESSAVSQYSFRDKIISPRFCDNVIQITKDSPHVSFSEFLDKENLRWHCFNPMNCDHAILIGGAMVSCRVRTAMLKGQEPAL